MRVLNSLSVMKILSALIILFKWGLNYNHPFSSLNMLLAFLGLEFIWGSLPFLNFVFFLDLMIIEN